MATEVTEALERRLYADCYCAVVDQCISTVEQQVDGLVWKPIYNQIDDNINTHLEDACEETWGFHA